MNKKAEMKAKELRIGNIVFDTEMGQIDTITAIEESRISLQNANLPYTPIEAIEAVELTLDWLERVGFEKHGSDDGTEQWWLMEKSSKSYTGKICLLSLSWHCYKNFFFYESLNHKIHHVHQLQNLVNVLTGKELTLKPEKTRA